MPFSAEYLVEINKVLLAMADVELLLNAPELNTGIYEDFSAQEDALKVLPQHYILSGEGKQQKKGHHLYNSVTTVMILLGIYRINMH